MDAQAGGKAPEHLTTIDRLKQGSAFIAVHAMPPSHPATSRLESLKAQL